VASLVKETSRTPEQQASRSEMSDCVQNHIRNLPENYRTVVVLHDLQGLKNREIAEILECSLDAVKVRLHRARTKLRKSLNLGCDMGYDEFNVLGCERKAADQSDPEISAN
jgi:RNA polymerase sigma-70 factor (ECF subfamily)